MYQPEDLNNPNYTERDMLERYLKSLSEKEYKGFKIAKEHLGCSFNLQKSNGYLKWKKENQSK